MATRGRPPKPAALKLLVGNPGKRDIPTDMLDPKALGNVEPPEYLSDTASDKWRDVQPMLARNGVFTEMDVDLLALYCEAYADMCEAREKMKFGKTHTAASGYESVTAWVTIAEKANKTMRDIMSVFGMGPSYRTKIHVDAQTQHGKETKESRLLG